MSSAEIIYPNCRGIILFLLQYKRVGYAAGKKIEINERRYTLEIKYKSSTGVLRLDQIEYYDLEPL